MKCSSRLIYFGPQQNGTPQPFMRISLAQRLGKFWGGFQKAMATWMTQKSEPKVYERCDRLGNLYYQVYDPVSGISAKFSSDTEIRIWLEQRYSR
jgi:hypothetical protein